MSAHLELQLLGNVTLLLDGKPVHSLRSRTAEALLIYVAAHERPLSRAFLADFFWDDRSSAQAGANLRAILSMLRKQFTDHLRITRHDVALDPEASIEIDAVRFEQQMEALAPSLQALAPMTSDVVTRLETTLSLYRGDFATGFYLSESRGFEEWLRRRREALRRLATLGLSRLAKDRLEKGAYESGIKHARDLLAVDPLNEEGQQQLMWLLLRNGQRTAALQQYQRWRKLLADQLDIPPAPATSALYRRIARLSFPPPIGLPPAGTPFVGREAALATLTGQLSRRSCRLLTILGPGGIGKTRLALETAQRLGEHRPGTFLNGIFWVPLEETQGAERLPLALARALNLPLQGREPITTQLLNYLQERELLLVLDNFETVVDGGRGTILPSRILQRATGVTLLVTSRERLRLREEWVFNLQGLAYPPAATAATAADYSAVRLFIQTATRARHDFAPTAADVQSIARLCARLEGLPLGIELAASAMRDTDSATIAAGVETGLKALKSTWRNVSARHGSLRAAFEHSWHLLPATEQVAVSRLFIFRGPFTAAASTAVATCPAALLATLVDKSMVHQLANGRFRLHDVIRQFLREKAERLPERVTSLSRAHVAYYLELVQRLEPDLIGTAQKEARRALLEEIENVRAAWIGAAEGNRATLLERALSALFAFYEKQSWFEEGETLFARAAAAISRKEPTPATRLLLARLQIRQARFLLARAHFEAANRLLAQSMEILAAMSPADDGSPAEVVHFERLLALGYLGVIAARQGAFAQAAVYGEEGLDLAYRLENLEQIAFCLNLLGNLALYDGDYERARRLQKENLALRRKQGNRFGEGVALNNLGSIAQAQGQYAEAGRLYELCYEVFERDDYRRGMAAALTNAGYVAWKQGSLAEAHRLHRKSLRLNRVLGDRRGEAVALANLGETALSAGAHAEAARNFEEGLALALAVRAVPLVLELLTGAADWLLSTGREAEAVPLLALVAAEAAATREIQERADHLRQVAVAALPASVTSELGEPPPTWEEGANMALALLAGHRRYA